MRISVLTLFPDMIRSVVNESLIGRAIKNGILEIAVYDIRDYAQNKHRHTDDYPFGGGSGMLMTPQPLFDCMEAAMAACKAKPHRIFPSPRGKVFDNDTAKRLAGMEEIILLCGHYEGVDEREVDALIDEEISLGDFILTGGEIPALAIIDSTARYVEGVLGNAASTQEESFNMGLLEHPQYTRPANFRGMEVPEVLLSGNHKEIQRWCRERSLELTYRLRPDLLEKAELSPADRAYLNQLEEYCPRKDGML